MNIIRSAALTFHNTNYSNNTNAAVSGTSSPSIVSPIDTEVHNINGRNRHRESSENLVVNLPRR